MKRLKLIFALLLLVTFFITSCDSAEAEKPNIVFLFADDQTYKGVAALGNDEIKTPNLDYLCETGITFTNAYNMGAWNGAVCVASRAMLNTGRFLWRAQSYDKNKKMWSELMSDAGYDTYMGGKWHTYRHPRDVFNHVGSVRGGMPEDTWPAYWNARKNNPNEPMPYGYERSTNTEEGEWKPWDKNNGGHWKGGKHWSEVLGDEAVGFINEAKDKDNPFFMYLAFSAPHDPRQSPKEYVDMYPLEDLSLPPTFQPEYPYKDSIGGGPTLRDAALAPYPRTELSIKTHKQEYYAIISHLDAQIGRILEALEASGEMKNTYIFYTADHGLAVGEHGLMGKQYMYDFSLRVPFFVIGPKIPKNKKKEMDIYLQDVMATALDLAGVEKPEYVEFNSLMPFLKNKRKESYYDAIYGSYMSDLQRMIRKDGYKLILYPHGKTVLLYDIENDPNESVNLAEDVKYKDKVKELFEDLQDLQVEMGDPLDLDAIFDI